MAITIYLVKNATGLNKRFSILDKQAYFFGGPVQFEERALNEPRSAFLAINEEEEASFLSALMSNNSDSLSTAYQESSAKDPWPSPPAAGKAPNASMSGITTKAQAESAIGGTANNTLAYRRVAVDDQSSPPTSYTVDLTNLDVFVFQGVIAFPAGHSLFLVIDDSEKTNVSSWASSSGLTFTELFDSSGTEPNYPGPAFNHAKIPFASAAEPAPRAAAATV